MTQEEKAQRYDEAIIKVKALYGQPLVDNTLLETIFPELKESENEKIRKAIHIYLDWLDGHKDYQPKGDYTIKDMIAWLEKQGEPIDEEKVLIGARKDIALSIINYLDNNSVGMCLSNMECEDIEDACVNSKWTKLYNYMKKKLGQSEVTKTSDQEKIAEIPFGAKDSELPTNGCDEQKPVIKMKSPEESLGISSKEYNDIVNDCLYGEQKPTNSYCQEHCKGYQETGKCFADGDCRDKREAERKSTWNEEDKKMVDNIIHIFKVNYSNNYYKVLCKDNVLPVIYSLDIINWLKSLKERMGG